MFEVEGRDTNICLGLVKLRGTNPIYIYIVLGYGGAHILGRGAEGLRNGTHIFAEGKVDLLQIHTP